MARLIPGGRFRSLPVALLLLTLLTAAVGCRSLATLAVYMIRGTNVRAEHPGLKNTTTVVVCRPVASVAFRDTGVSQDLARRVNSMLGQRVKGINVIDSQEVASWLDERFDSDYTFAEVGHAFHADRVVGIELSEFDLYKGQTLYQGTATVRVVVRDLTQNDRITFEKEIPRIVWPPNVGVPTGEREKSEFRRQFLGVIADHVGRYFYDHDPYSDYAQDAAALQY
jgi:hypothetical protein